jgi:hypothetical protein
MSSTFIGASDIGCTFGIAERSFGFFLASRLGRSREPIDGSSALAERYLRPLHAGSSAANAAVLRPARIRSSASDSGKLPARIADRILLMKSRVKVRL